LHGTEQLDGMEISESAIALTDCRTTSFDDDGIGHDGTPCIEN
jgi:hypothetical protein